MIKFKDKTFNNYLDLFYYCLSNDIPPQANWFPGSSHFYMKAHLEEKFHKKFTHREIKALLAYAKDHQKIETGTHSVSC